MSSPPPSRVRCRQIAKADLEAVADLLTRGFPLRTRKYWTSGLERLEAQPAIEGCPQFGYCLEADGRIVGVLLLIFSTHGAAADVSIRCNVSSWYVEEAFRNYAPQLVSQAVRLRHVTYLNTSPAAHTWPILTAQGYSRYTEGQVVSLPALGGAAKGVKVSSFQGRAWERAMPDYDLIRAHLEAGCIGLVCETDAGPLPFLFVRRPLAYAPVGVAQLIYCRDTDAYVRCAGAIGRHLLARGILCVLCDADAPVAGLPGVFVRNKQPRYFRGPVRPRMNDLSFTETVIFGP
ncbi:MAG: hypothetical protein ACHP7N_05145 [Caulobacterales bacterium]